MMRDDITHLRQTLAAYAAVPVSYAFSSGAETPRPLLAIPGRTLFRAENDCGVTVRTETRDFLIDADLLPREPQRGDVITFEGRRYEVLAPNDEPVWRWSGAFHLTYRIHTKGIS